MNLSIVDYIDKFTSLTSQTTVLHEEVKKVFFLCGLHKELRATIEANPSNLVDLETLKLAATRVEYINNPKLFNDTKQGKISDATALKVDTSNHEKFNQNGLQGKPKWERKNYPRNQQGKSSPSHDSNAVNDAKRAGNTPTQGQQVKGQATANYAENKTWESHLQDLSAIALNCTSTAFKASASRTQFVVDSGCSQHMSPQKDLFSILRPISKQIMLANNTVISAKGIGTIPLELDIP